MSELEDCVNLLARAIHRKMHSFHPRHELAVSKDGGHNLRFLQTRNESMHKPIFLIKNQKRCYLVC